MSLGVIIDVAQTVIIIALTVVVAFSFRDGDRRLKALHCEVQDAIVSQHVILKQVEDLQAQVDELALEVTEKCGQLEDRLHRLEGA